MPRELGRRDKPLVVFAEDFYLKFRTSDPANPAPNEMWGRSDLNSGDKVATLRWNESGTPYEEIPVFTPGTSGENVEEVLAMQTPNGEGYIPATSVSPTYSQLALQHSGETLGWHDAIEAEVPAIPDSGGSHQWAADEGSGSTLGDSIGSLDGTINGPSWQTGGKGSGEAYLDYDATDGITDLGSTSQSELSHFVAGNGTVAFWVNPNDVSAPTLTILGTARSADENNVWFGFDSGNIRFSLVANTGSFSVNIHAGNPSNDTWQLIAATEDGSTARVYHATATDNQVTEVGSESITDTDTGDLTHPVGLGARGDGGEDHYGGGVDLGYTDETADSESKLNQWLTDTKGLYS